MDQPAKQSIFTTPPKGIIPPLSSPWVWGVPLAGVLALLLIWLTGSNQTLFLAINHDLPLPDALWANLTILGDTVVALALVLPFCWRRPDLIRALMVAALIATLTLHGLKALVGAMRPAALLENVHIIGPLLMKGSFPSGHTTTIFTLVSVLCLLNLRRPYMAVLIILALAVGLSRCAVGAHWPMDVAAGAVNGWLAGVAGVHLARGWRGGLSLTAQRIFGAVLFLCAVSLLVNYDTHYPQALILQYLVASVTLALSASSLWHLLRGQ